MDWTKVKAGDVIEPHTVAWREWRYRLDPLRLLSLSYRLEWSPERPMESYPDIPGGGIYGLVTKPTRWAWSQIESAGPQDGYVIGRVALWGVCWDHELGYRAQYARPVSFDEARGTRADEALERLRRLFLVREAKAALDRKP